jgi:hypothetical protein
MYGRWRTSGRYRLNSASGQNATGFHIGPLSAESFADPRAAWQLHQAHLAAALIVALRLRFVDALEVSYVKNGDVSIAYSTIADGPFDVVFVAGWILSVFESAWDGPAAEALQRLASFSRRPSLSAIRHEGRRGVLGVLRQSCA